MVEAAIILFVIISFMWAGDTSHHAISTKAPSVSARQSFER